MMILATLCYVKQNGKTLMLHRVKREGDMHQGKWNGLGGKIRPGETPEECAVREVREESGLMIQNPRLRGVLTFPDFNGAQSWYAFVFTITEFEGTAFDECDEGRLEWVEDHRLTELLLWEGDRFFLDWLNQDRFFSGKFVYQNGRLIRHDATFYG